MALVRQVDFFFPFLICYQYIGAISSGPIRAPLFLELYPLTIRGKWMLPLQVDFDKG
jgi:hypothetical protein